MSEYGSGSYLARTLFRQRVFFYGELPSDQRGHLAKAVATEGVSIRHHAHPAVLSSSSWSERVHRGLMCATECGHELDVFTAHDDRTDTLVGLATLLKVFGHAYWHDSLPQRPGEARLGSVRVEPRWRGRGIGRALQARRYLAACADDRIALVSAIVESHRLPSLKGAQKVFQHSASNYLVKVAGRNVLSIVTGGPHKGAWYVGPGGPRQLL